MDVYPDFPGAIEISGTVDEESGGFGGVAYLAEQGLFLEAARRPRHHPRAAEQGPHLPRPSRRLVGGDRDQGRDRAWLDAVPRRLRGAPHGRGAASLRGRAFPALDRKRTRMPVVPEGARRSTMNINSIHGGQTDDFRPGLPSPNVPDSCRHDHRPALPAGGEHRRGEERGDRHPRPAEARAAEIRLRDPRHDGSAAADDRARRAGRRGRWRKAFAKSSAGSRTMSSRPAPTTRSTLPASAICTTASPTGPGILDLAHRPDEWVGIADMVESAKVMAIGLDVLLRGASVELMLRREKDFRASSLPSRQTRFTPRRNSGFYPRGCNFGRETDESLEIRSRAARWRSVLEQRRRWPRAPIWCSACALEPPHLDPTAGAAAAIDEVALRQCLRGPDPHRPARRSAAGARRELDRFRRRQDLHLQASRPA